MRTLLIDSLWSDCIPSLITASVMNSSPSCRSIFKASAGRTRCKLKWDKCFHIDVIQVSVVKLLNLENVRENNCLSNPSSSWWYSSRICRRPRVGVLASYKEIRWCIDCASPSTSARCKFNPPRNTGTPLITTGKVFITPNLGSRAVCSLSSTCEFSSKDNTGDGYLRDGHQ